VRVFDRSRKRLIFAVVADQLSNLLNAIFRVEVDMCNQLFRLCLFPVKLSRPDANGEVRLHAASPTAWFRPIFFPQKLSIEVELSFQWPLRSLRPDTAHGRLQRDTSPELQSR